MPEKFDVFLSHNRRDKPAVRRLKKRLVKEGITVWLDEDELQPGIPWQDLLEQGIKNSHSVVVLIGKDGLGPWEVEEMRGALSLAVRDKERPVIPVLLPKAPSQPDLPMFLGSRTWVDLSKGLLAKGIAKLVWGIKSEKPDATASPEPSLTVETTALSGEVLAEQTSLVKQRIASVAKNWLDTECAPFVVPSLARHIINREQGGMSAPSRTRQPLDEHEIDRITRGELPSAANRIRVVGDSGMGKTALLHYCEFRIAAADDGRLPVRIDGLSGYNWTLGRDEIFRWMIDRVLHRSLPERLQPEQAVEWLSELVAQGRVVFLLDALDQTDQQQFNEAGLRTFLQSAGVIHCPVIMTLRPEVDGSAVFTAADWDTVQSEGFHEEAQRRQYLGEVANDLLTEEDEQWKSRESYQRKQQWADLLEIPLLLKMLRDLAKVDDRWIEILESLFEREHRNGCCLHAAWQLIESCDQPWAVAVRERFLNEFPKMLEDTRCSEHAMARTLTDTERFARCPLEPADDDRPFLMGSPEKEEFELGSETPQHETRITPFQLQRTPVNNLQFELFDPSHRLRRVENNCRNSVLRCLACFVPPPPNYSRELDSILRNRCRELFGGGARSWPTVTINGRIAYQNEFIHRSHHDTSTRQSIAHDA